MRSLLLSSLALLPALALAQPDASSFPSCLAGLQKKAQAQGISADSYERFTSGLQADLSVLDLLDAQPEFTTPLWDYLAGLVDEQRVSDGKAMLAQHDKLLDQVAARYGVDKYTVVAVWGVESDYGRIFGKRPLLTSLSTLSCYGRRQSFFQGEFLATLKLLQAGDIRDAGITGSWAGAVGHTQFMPSTYARIAVDFDGDGKRDIWGSPGDALASTANYLKASGWIAGQPWGFEVRLPAGFDYSLAELTIRKPLGEWQGMGVQGVNGGPLPSGLSGEQASLLLPAGHRGPAFLVLHNFRAILKYNNSSAYALAVGLLADSFKGGGRIVGAWPLEDVPLSRSQRIELQRQLAARGHDPGAVDGIIGANTRKAIRACQQEFGWPADGYPTPALLDRLRTP